MNARSGEKHMDARVGSVLERLPGALYIRCAGASERGDGWAADGLDHRLDCGKVPLGSDGESCFDHIHAQPVQLLRKAELFLHIHAATRRLFTVPKRRIEYCDPRSFHARTFPKPVASMVKRKRPEAKLIIISNSIRITN